MYSQLVSLKQTVSVPKHVHRTFFLTFFQRMNKQTCICTIAKRTKNYNWVTFWILFYLNKTLSTNEANKNMKAAKLFTLYLILMLGINLFTLFSSLNSFANNMYLQWKHFFIWFLSIYFNIVNATQIIILGQFEISMHL